MYGGIWTTPESDKACFLGVVYVQGASNHHPNISGIQTYGGVQAYRGYPNIQGHPNIQGGIWGASKHTGDHPNIWGHPNILGHPNVWGIWTPPYSDKACFLVLCMYRGHPNIWEAYFFLYNLDLYLSSCFFFIILNIVSIF